MEGRSLGPFGYQHMILTGAAPNSLLIHEESQTQLFYRFKVDYFHMSLFTDPNSTLAGSKFNWQESDIKNGEFRAIEKNTIETGLYFGHFSLLLPPYSDVNLGIKAREANVETFIFESKKLQLPRYGLAFQNHFIKFDFVAGQGKTEFDSAPTHVAAEYVLDIVRLNAEYEFRQKYKLNGSYIQRKLTSGDFSSDSTTGVFYLDYKNSYKYLTRGMLSVERVTSNQRTEDLYIKLGVNFNIIF